MRIGIVLVTFNRLSELKKSLLCYEEQTYTPTYIIVVDNHSSDGTDAYLKEWQSEQGKFERNVISLETNEGGSGGFYAGLKAAQEKDAEWIWVADDDAFPNSDAFEQAVVFTKDHPDLTEEASALCGMCEYEGRIASVQRIRLHKTLFGIHELPVKAKEFSKEYFYIDMYSFVGTILRKESLLKAGLPKREYFIYQDDLEHGLRMRKQGKIICIPKICINHKDNYFLSKGVSWRDYYATRNITLMYAEHFDKKSLNLRISRRLLIAYLSGNRKKLAVIKEAIKDGKAGKTGLHPVYKPGWKVD